METTSSPRWVGWIAYAMCIGLLCLSSNSYSQTPTVTVRLANPSYDCNTENYCLDVEFRSDIVGEQLFGMNVRLFYDDSYLEIISLSDFQGGYGPLGPNPGIVSTSAPGFGTTYFGFPAPGVTDFVNMAIQLLDANAPPIPLDDVVWSKLYQVCFTIEGPLADSANFCPPIVWDLEQNPANGGYLAGDDGVVMTVVRPAPAMSGPSFEAVAQYNWAYVGQGLTPPFGEPRPVSCLTVGCSADFALTKSLIGGPNDFNPGDDVDFLIEITNEGDISAGEIHLIDYIPTGFSLNDPDWTAGNIGVSGLSASIILSSANLGLPPAGLLPGESITVEITLTIDANIPSGEYQNFAEIAFVYDTDDIDISNQDVDSDPDEIDTNDPPAEDDHDGALVCLIAPPVITGELFVCPGETARYGVENYNPLHTYTFTLSGGGGFIMSTTDSSVTIVWNNLPGGPYQVGLTETGPLGCSNTSEIDVSIEAPGAIACITQTNISIDNGCGTVVMSGMILTGEMQGNNTYQVFVIDMNGDTVPDATLTWEHVGQMFTVSVVSRCNGQSCWGKILVEDKLGPIIDCVCPLDNQDERCAINCMEIQQFLEGNIPDHFRPTVIDNCGNTTLVLADVQLTQDPCGDGYIIVDWLATDGSGNTSTCRQEFAIIPLTLATLQFPDDYLGECGDNTDPSHTGWPQILGFDLTENSGYCNILRSYNDRLVELCGGGSKIVRTWKVTDWCVSRSETRVQMIHLGDHTGPQLTCPSDMTISTNVLTCSASVIVNKPVATDACSDIISYQLSYSGGIVAPLGNVYVLRDLPIGVHTMTWKVTDECYNSTICTFNIRVKDDVPPTVSCHLHTVVSLTSYGQNGLTLVDASVLSDGSYDNCSGVTFRARRMDSCLEFDWTTEGACMDQIPGGNPPINSRDHGTVLRPCVPFACCDVGREGLMVELEVTDAAGNKNYCMVEVEVQDKLAPQLTCPNEITLSCTYPLIITEGLYNDADGNQNGMLDEDPLSAIFGNMLDAARFHPSDREPVIINDPDNPNVDHPQQWGIDGWALDNCPLELSVEVRVTEDCSGLNLPGTPPNGAVKLVERIFRGTDGTTVRQCTQRIWVVNYDLFFIQDTSCLNENPLDGVIWPCDAMVDACIEEEDTEDTGEPVILNDGCSHVGVSHKDTRFENEQNECIKIIRKWKVLDWCQYNEDTGAGLWTYDQEIIVDENFQGGILEGVITSVQTDAVSLVSVNLSGPQGSSQEIITAQDGKFHFSQIPSGEDYRITPQRNDNHRNGVSTLDLVKIQKHLLGLEVFSSPYQYIAADANNSQSVSAIDLIEIRKLILGVQDEFSQNQSWRFVQKESQMVQGNPWPFNEYISVADLSEAGLTDIDFVGVKIGDVNNSAQANANQLMPRNGNKTIHVKASGNGQVTAEEEIELELVFPKIVSGFQWTMETPGLEFISVESQDIAINNQNAGQPEEGITTMSWNGELLSSGANKTEMSITVKLKAIESGRLINMIGLSDKITKAEAYSVEGDLLDVDLVFGSVGVFTDYALYQNKPNPWNSQTLIGFHLPADADARLTVYDMNGRVIKTISEKFRAGYNSVILTAEDIPASGVLYYRLESGEYVASKKMVSVKQKQ